MISRTACMVAVLLAASGCLGGGSGNGGVAISNPPPPGGEPDPGRDLLVHVTARDPFGAPVPDATIMLLYSAGTGYLESPVRTDADGQATIDRAPNSTYAVLLTGEALYGSDYEATPVFLNETSFDVTLHPFAELSSGVGRVNVTDVSDDARQLTFSARLYIIETYADEEGWHWGSIDVEPCDACIEGPGGFTAAFSGRTRSNELLDPDPVADRLAIALLLDQGAGVATTDPADKRLLAARYLPTRLGASDEMVLAAFADDDEETGQIAMLPSQPVTIFPVDDPAFTTDGHSYFAAIESLATLEGGGSPLYEAAGEMVDFTANAAPVDSRSVVVVVTGAGASGCGEPAECRAGQETLLARSASTGVPVVAVELADPAGGFDRKGLGPLAQSEGGAVFWAENADQLPTILGRVPEVLDGRHAAIDVTIQLESPVAGAFTSGNTVEGTLQVVVCPFDCSVLLSVPFGLRVP
jgi:hypothetical protein